MAGMADILLKAGQERGIRAVLGEGPDTVMVCRDGRVKSHRLLLGATGHFLRTLLARSFLPGEDSLVLLPEHSLRDLLHLVPASVLLRDGSLLVGDQQDVEEVEPKLEDSSGEESEGTKMNLSRMSDFAKGRKRDSSGKLLPSEEREELNRAVEKLLLKDGEVWSCQVCGKTADHKASYNNLKQHIETHLPVELRERCGSYTLKARHRKRKARANDSNWAGKETKDKQDFGQDDVDGGNFDYGDVDIEDSVKIEAAGLDVELESSGKADYIYPSNVEESGDGCESDSEEDYVYEDDEDYEEEILKSRKRAYRGSHAKTRPRDERGQLLPNPDRVELIREVDKILVKDGEDWSCGVCNKKCTEKEKTGKSYGNLRAHIETHLPKELRQKCGKKFATPKDRGGLDLQIDEIIGKSGELWLCTMCMKYGPSKYSIRNHIETHLEFMCCCELCGKQFPTRDGLRSHTNFVHVEGNIAKNLTCEKCGKTGMSKSQLGGHNSRHHSVTNPGGFKCPVCNIVVKEKSTLRSHMKLHDPNRPQPKLNTCEFCGKSGMTNRMYAGHKRRNHADKHKIDLETKLAVIRAREQPNATTREVARSFNLGLSTVQLILRHKDVHIDDYNRSKESTLDQTAP